MTASVGGRTQSMGDYTLLWHCLSSPFIEYTEDEGANKANLEEGNGYIKIDVRKLIHGFLNINLCVPVFRIFYKSVKDQGQLRQQHDNV